MSYGNLDDFADDIKPDLTDMKVESDEDKFCGFLAMLGGDVEESTRLVGMPTWGIAAYAHDKLGKNLVGKVRTTDTRDTLHEILCHMLPRVVADDIYGLPNSTQVFAFVLEFLTADLNNQHAYFEVYLKAFNDSLHDCDIPSVSELESWL